MGVACNFLSIWPTLFQPFNVVQIKSILPNNRPLEKENKPIQRARGQKGKVEIISSIQLPNISCLKPEWKTYTGFLLRTNAIPCFPWLLGTYCTFVHPCFAVSAKAKEKYLGISRVPQQDGCNLLSGSTKQLTAWTWDFYSASPLSSSQSVFTQLPSAPPFQSGITFLIYLCSQNSVRRIRMWTILAQLLCPSCRLSDPMT